MAALPTIGAKPGSLTVALGAKKDASASASNESSAAKQLFTRAGRDSASQCMEAGCGAATRSASGKYVRRANRATGFGDDVKPG